MTLFKKSALACALSAAIVQSAVAAPAFYTFSIDNSSATTGTWTRPSGQGGTYNYAAVYFTPTLDFTDMKFGQSEAGVDTVMYVYRGVFDPNQPAGFLKYNDDTSAATHQVILGSGATIMDNFHQGGMGVLVDTERGCLVGNGFDKKVNESPVSPTGVVFDGYPIPYWDEVVEMVCEAALVNQGVKLIGWDVALAQDGPLLIEANRGPGWDVTQVPAQHGQKELLNEMLREVGAPERP